MRRFTKVDWMFVVASVVVLASFVVWAQVYGPGKFSYMRLSSKTAPTTTGDQDVEIYFQTSDGVLYRYDGSTHVSLESQGHGDGANCTSIQAPIGVDADGAVEGCWTPVSGPSSSTDNCIVRFDSTTGKVIQQGTTCPTYNDSGVITVGAGAIHLKTASTFTITDAYLGSTDGLDIYSGTYTEGVTIGVVNSGGSASEDYILNRSNQTTFKKTAVFEGNFTGEALGVFENTLTLQDLNAASNYILAEDSAFNDEWGVKTGGGDVCWADSAGGTFDVCIGRDGANLLALDAGDSLTVPGDLLADTIGDQDGPSTWDVDTSGDATFNSVTTSASASPLLSFDDSDFSGTEAQIDGAATADNNGCIKIEVEEAASTYVEGVVVCSSGGAVTIKIGDVGDGNYIQVDESGQVTFVGTASFIPPNGADPPSTCTVGEMFLDTDETDDTNCTTTNDNSWCLCTATNTWSAFENN